MSQALIGLGSGDSAESKTKIPPHMELTPCRGWWTTLMSCCSVAQLCTTLCNPMDWSMPGFLSFTISQSVQFSSVAQSSLTLCNPINWSTPGLPIRHQLTEPTQTHVHWVSDIIQLSHPLSSPSPALNLSHHQGLFKWVSSLHQVAKVLEFQLQHQSFQWILRTDFL